MKQWKKHLVAALTATVAGSTLVGMTVQADTESSAIPEGVVLNYHEVKTWDTSFSDESASDIPRVYGILPESYSSSSNLSDSMSVDLQDDYVTAAKYQNGGSCWAHSAISLAETSYIKNEGITDTIHSGSIDFNEYHLVHYTYHTPTDPLNLFGGDKTENITGVSDLNVGGNVENSLCNFANWIGASDDTDFSASDVAGNVSDDFAYEDAAHLENGYILSMPDLSSDTYQNDMTVIKQMIMDYGSVSTSYYAADAPYYLGGYQYCDTERTTNHAITIVGWDDSISASSFSVEAPGDGAWLVKNSWGTGWGLNGYFWLSYYDVTIGDNAVVLDFTSSDNYDNNYQYDGSGNVWGATWGYMNQTAAANAFVADSAESLEAIGFYTYSNNMDYEIRVYRNLEKGALPQSGELVLTQSGSEAYAGFHTVKLNKTFILKENERYAIVITWKKNGSYVFVCADETYDYGWVSFTSYAKAGESYWGSSVEELEDLNPDNTKYADGMNVRIKAFTNEVQLVNVTGISLNKTSATLASGKTLQLTATISPANATYQGVTFSSSDISLATVSANGLVTANSTGKTGTVTITATSEDGSKTASCKITIQPVQVTKITLSQSSVSLKPAGTVTLTATVAPTNATNNGVKWSSSNKKVATVDKNGKVTAVAEGSVTITATAKDGSGVTAGCVITVGHDWNTDYTIDQAATLTSTGSKSIHCKNCDATKDVKTISYLKGLSAAVNGVRYYYENGKVNTSVTTLVKDNGTWYYVEKGVVTGKYTGLVQYNGNWYYVQNSVLNWNYTGLCKYGSTWYYVEKGVLNWNYTGLCKYGSTWYYVQKGVLNWNYTGLCKYGSTWY